MFQIQNAPTSRMFLGKRAGFGSDLLTFAPLNGLVSWWQLGDYYGFISGSFVQGVTGLDQGPANATLSVLSGIAFSGDTSRGDNNGAASFGPTSFTGRNDFSTGNFNPAGSFTIAVWVKLTSFWDGDILSYSSGADLYWALHYDSTALAFTWFVQGTGATPIINDLEGVQPQLNTWYLVECYYDAPGKTAGIRVMETRSASRNARTMIAPVEAALPSGRARVNANFRLGARVGTGSFIGLICGVGFWSRRLNLLEVGSLNYPNDYPWQFFSPASGALNPYAAAGPAPSDLYATGNPRIVGFTDNTAGAYPHEIWRDDGGGYFLLATLGNSVTEYQDDTAITETSEFGTEGGDDQFQPEHDTTFLRFGAEVQSRYKVRAVGYGEPSAFSTEFDPGTASLLATEDDEPLTTEGGNPAILE